MRYDHKQIVYNNILFDSEMECEYYKKISTDPNITEIRVHPEYVIIPPFEYYGKKVNATVYTPDFEYKENGIIKVIEIKGFPTRDFELRLKLWKYLNQDKPISIMCYSKKTGWKELTEYKKERKAISKQEAIERILKNKALEEQKHKDKINKLIERKKQIESKLKPTKAERERLEQINNILRIEEL